MKPSSYRRIIRTSVVFVLSLWTLNSCDTQTVTNHGPNPAGRLYVANQGDGTLYIYDTRTMTRIATESTLVAKPHFMQFSPDKMKYYISTVETNGRIARYDASTNNLEGTLSIPGVICSAVDIAPDNVTGFVCNYNLLYSPTRLYKLNLNGAMAVVDSFSAGKSTHDVKFTSDGKTVIACNMYSDDVTILDLTTDPPTPTFVPMDPLYLPAPNTHNYAPKSALILPGDLKAILACHEAHQLKILDIPGRLVIDSIHVGLHNHGTHEPGKQYGPALMALSPDGDVVWVSGMWDNKIWAVRLSTKTVIFEATTSTGNTFGVAISSDGSRVYVSATNAAGSAGRVYIIDARNNLMMDSITVGLNPYGLSWQPE